MTDEAGAKAQESAQVPGAHETVSHADEAEDIVPLSESEKATAYKVTVAECSAFYKMVWVIASTFLGGTLVFIEKIAPKPERWTLNVLLGGWVFLILSVIAIVWVRRFNIEAGRRYLEQKYTASEKVQVKARFCTDVSGVLLGLGMLMVMLFGFFNFRSGGVAGPGTSEKADAGTASTGSTGGDRSVLGAVRPTDQHEPAVRHPNAQADPSTVRPISSSSPPIAASSETQQVRQP